MPFRRRFRGTERVAQENVSSRVDRVFSKPCAARHRGKDNAVSHHPSFQHHFFHFLRSKGTVKSINALTDFFLEINKVRKFALRQRKHFIHSGFSWINASEL